MTSRFELKPETEINPSDRSDLVALSRAVYPPDEVTDWPGRHLDWSQSEHRVLVRDQDTLVAHVAIVVRTGECDGVTVVIGGIGGVQTHPEHRGQGHATAAIARASAFLEERRVDFGLLVCEPRLFAFYENMGWRRFDGRLLTLQKGETTEFTFNEVMVLPVLFPAPVSGTIDLLGPPW